MPALSIRSLSKSFRFGHRRAPQRREALRGVDLDVEEGEVVAIVGDEGSGKTTLLMCATGLLRGDSGSIQWYGRRLAGGLRHPDLVYVPPVPSYYPFLTVRDVLSRNAHRGNSHSPLARTIDDFAHRLSLTTMLTVPVGELKIAELKLVAIAGTFIAEPKAIVLDGTLDALSDGTCVSHAIKEESARGSTLIVASRHVSVVARAATRIAVMEAGRISASFSAESREEELSTSAVAFSMLGARVRQIAERVH